MSGLLISDRAMVSRRRMPPDSASTGLSAFSVSWAKSSSSAVRFADHGPLESEVAPVDVQVLPHRQLAVEGVVLRHDAEPRAYRGTVRPRVHPEHAQRPAGARRGRRDHAHRRRLARAVRAEEPERLPATQLEPDPVDGTELRHLAPGRVDLAEIGRPDQG